MEAYEWIKLFQNQKNFSFSPLFVTGQLKQVPNFGSQWRKNVWLGGKQPGTKKSKSYRPAKWWGHFPWSSDSWCLVFYSLPMLLCREFARRPSRSPPELLLRSTTLAWPWISTPTSEWLVRLPSFLQREWETRLLALSPTWWREFQEALFVVSHWSCKRRSANAAWTLSQR